MLLSKEGALQGLDLMLQSRLFEKQIASLFQTEKMHGTTHLNIGQEACQAGLALAIEKGDWVVPTHRCHGYNVVTKSSLFKMFSEMFGSSHGLCKGLGGSMHMSDKEHWNLGSSAVVASGVALAAGAAFALKKQAKKNISVALFGDGATSRGVIHEVMNMASLWHLPLLFYCENNGYGMSAPSNKMISISNPYLRAQGYSMEGEIVDGNDLEKVYEAVKKARKYILEKNKPYYIELITYRLNGHSKSDTCVYRNREEEKYWKGKCPIINFKNKLIKDKLIDEDEYKQICLKNKNYVESELQKAFDHRDEVLTIEEAKSFVFSPQEEFYCSPKSFHRAYGREAIREALYEESKNDSNVFVVGEDIGVYGGCFKVTGNLYKKIGKQMLETPISEEGFGGMAVGAAMLGIRPVVEIMYGDFATLVSDAIINHASKTRFMSAGQFNCPVVFRFPMGCGTGHGSQHSQSLESLFTNVPGLKIITPSSPRKAKALLKSSIKDDNPVLFIEHKLLYSLEGEIGDENDYLNLEKADIEREGSALSLISYGYSTQVCREAINTLVSEDKKYEGLIELVDLCSIKPIDIDTIRKSVLKTKRALIVHESPLFGGVSGEIAASLYDDSEIFSSLKAPIARLGGEEIPIPFNCDLEKIVVPTVAKVVKQIKKLIN